MTFRSIVLGVGIAVAATAPASAATFNIAFLDTDGTSVGSGTFTAEAKNLAAATAFSATIQGTTYSSLISAFGLFLSTDFPNPGDLAVFGFAFKPGETPATNSGVLQMNAFGQGSAPSLLVTQWTITTCNEFACGGGDALGSYAITVAADPEPPVVPLPASAALLPLGLVALGALRRRKTG